MPRCGSVTSSTQSMVYSSPNAVSLAVSGGSSQSVSYPVFKSVAGKGKNTVTTVKITKATMRQTPSGKVLFEKEGQIFIEVTEDTATVLYLSAAAKREYGESFILVTSDGLEILDRAATKGLKFWKIPSRKVYAIDAEAIEIPTFSTSAHSNGPPLKRRHPSQDMDFDPQIQGKLDDLKMSLESVSKDVSKIVRLTPQTSIPMNLKVCLLDTFVCKICHESPMKPPIVMAICCKTIIIWLFNLH